MGTTDVVASVKAELGKPDLLQPDKGRVIINVDCSLTEAPVFKRCLLGSTIGTNMTISDSAAALQRCFLGSKSGTGVGNNCSSLIIMEGKLCWDLYVDGLVVSSDGNLLDALGAAIKVGNHFIVDATSEEESQMSSALSISINRNGHICGLTKQGGAGLDPSVILDMISLAKDVSEQ